MELVRVKRATEADIEPLYKFAARYWLEIGEVQRRTLRIQQQRGGLLIAWVGGRMVGYVVFRVFRNGTARVYKVLVDEKQRWRGVGRTLMATAMLAARGEGATRMVMDLAPEHAADGFLNALGFTLGRTKVRRNGDVVNEWVHRLARE